MPACLWLTTALGAVEAVGAQGTSTPETDDAFILFSAGLFNIADQQDVVELGAEWRGRPRAWKLRLNVGAMLHDNSGGYGFVGLRRDAALSPKVGISIGLAAGLYEEGDGLDLGGAVEFRSSIEVYFDVSARSRLGVDFYHLSHAGLGDEKNPGSNSLVVVYGFRLR